MDPVLLVGSDGVKTFLIHGIALLVLRDAASGNLIEHGIMVYVMSTDHEVAELLNRHIEEVLSNLGWLDGVGERN